MIEREEIQEIVEHHRTGGAEPLPGIRGQAHERRERVAGPAAEALASEPPEDSDRR